MGGVKKDVCKFKAINIAKKYGLTPKISSSGKNIGTKIIKISVHSNGPVSYTHLTLPTNREV